MYQLVYYYMETVDNRRNVYKKYKSGDSASFRLRKNALHYVREIVQSDYRADGYGTEQIVGGIYCYKSEKINDGGVKIIEINVKVEKVEKVGQ